MSDITTEQREGLYRKLRALQALADRAGTEAEALLAAERMQSLLTKYDLTMTDVELSDKGNIEEDRIPTTDRKYGSPMQKCLSAIADFCDCKSWMVKDFDRSDPTEAHNWARKVHHIFFGRKSDTEAARYLYHIIQHAMNEELKRYKKGEYYKEVLEGYPGDRKRASRSFQIGFASRISARLYAMKKEQNRKVQENTGRALVPLKMSAVDAAFKEAGLEINTISSKAELDRTAWNAGGSAAAHIPLSKGVEGNISSGMLT